MLMICTKKDQTRKNSTATLKFNNWLIKRNIPNYIRNYADDILLLDVRSVSHGKCLSFMFYNKNYCY